jgi:hypothetical protein
VGSGCVGASLMGQHGGEAGREEEGWRELGLYVGREDHYIGSPHKEKEALTPSRGVRTRMQGRGT